MMKAIAGTALPQIAVTISSDDTNVDLYAEAGSPAYRCVATITIAAGVRITNAGLSWSLRTGTWVAGSVVKLVNNGSILGDGGLGSGGEAPGGVPANGDDGTDAISLDYDLTIDNTNGFIFGGGGGGAGGFGAAHAWGGGGGGGGGGQGVTGGIGAAGGAPGGAVGDNGSEAGAGGGGAAGRNIYGAGGDGAAGGGWGQNGGGTLSTTVPPVWVDGGNAGNAVKPNSFAVTWAGGYNSSQVKGPVA